MWRIKYKLSNNRGSGYIGSFKSIPDMDKPRERLVKYGSGSLSNEELIAIILRSGNRKYSVKDIACNLLSSVSDVREFKKMNLHKLQEIDGISLIKAIELQASLELGRRVYEDISLEDVISCTNPVEIIGYFNNLFRDKRQEEFYVLYLDNKKKYLDIKFLFRGSINFSVVHPREIFKEAYLLSSSFIICLHNHPSGDPTPSKQDIDITRKIRELGIIHDINLVDHIIIGNNSYFSFYENNLIIK